jgi:hypothetical protein
MGKEKERSRMKKKAPKEPTKIEVPLDIALSLLTADELAKLKRYVTAYAAKYGESTRLHNYITACEHEQLKREQEVRK